MNNKLYYILISGLLCMLLTVTAFANELVPVEDEVLDTSVIEEPSEILSEPSELLSEPVLNEGEELVGDVSENSSEPKTEPTIEYTLDGATVNLAPESIDAIATAVNEKATSYRYDYQYEFIGVDGTTFILDTDFPDLITDHKVVVGLDWNGSARIFIDTDFYLKSGKFYPFNYDNGLMTTLNRNVITRFTISSLQDVVQNAYVTSFLWANHHIYDAKTNDLLFASPILPEPSFTFSFVTGFDDLIIPDQDISEPLPTPTYDGYVFMGWYLDSDSDELYTNDIEITQDTTLYARFEETPPMGVFHESVFGSLGTLFQCEPITYILALLGTAIIFAIAKSFIQSRL